MTSLLIAFLLILLLPLFIATWRTSLLGLACQGAIMGWIAFTQHPEPSAGTVVALVDLIGLRALFAPLLLYGVLRAQKAARRNDVIPPNMFSWTVALVLVLLAFQFGEAAVPNPGEQQTFVAVASAALLLGFMVLSTQSVPASQVIGALRIENAIALFELSAPTGGHELGIRMAQMVIYTLSVALFAFYLRTLHARSRADDVVPRPPI
jgi:hydrogenase-4 component E